ncbi:hypothetical protein PoB_001799300 [Plakobranchus ocellatus]|uniref:DUF7043 domain-containing protein n=1 Tax=Plakobranchus ocellatus TaxID=259542 RepID=A0AAV3Z9Q5_9GAST|nr:hypothetical protein PoB_001799300 [Plakobranchus ocellatus]
MAAGEETCHFPMFLQSSQRDGVLKPWSANVWWLYLRHAPKWEEKQEIVVKNGHIWRTREHNRRTCERSVRRAFRKTSFSRCTDRQMVHNRTCISEEGRHTYRVIHYGPDSTHRFTCMKFEKRSNNVVQVYEGPLSNTNDPDLCDPKGLRLEEWPWTASWKKEHQSCPVSGGFSFRTIRRLTNEDLCDEEWRKSTLEVECMKEDGMEFITPSFSNCNPFIKHGDVKRLACWAGWEYGDFIFIIASDPLGQPRYCLRFPKVQKGEFSVMVYFSVICPTEDDGKAPSGIEYYELIMHRKDPYKCEDEDVEKCKELIITPDQCAKDKKYAQHCPLTCRRCPIGTIQDLNTRRCQFPPTVQGTWNYYTDRHYRAASVEVTLEEAKFSHLSSFQCLAKDKEERKFKLASILENGCSPRFTCMEFKRRNNNVLQYRISPSDRVELPMDDLCNFRDDSEPLNDYIRSYNFRNLILANDMWPSFCGLNSVVPFNGTVNGRLCQGYVSDWDQDKCTTKGTLSLISSTCNELVLPIEFQCLAFIHDDSVPLQQLLLTRSLDGTNTFNCWILTSYLAGDQFPLRILYQIPTAQCSLVTEVDLTDSGYSNAVLYLDDRKKTKECTPKVEKISETQRDVTKQSTTIVSNTNSNGASDKSEAQMENSPSEDDSRQSPPIANQYNTDPPYQSFFDEDGTESYKSSIMILVSLFIIAKSLPYFLFNR